MEQSSRQAERARRKVAFFLVRFRSPAKLSGAMIMCKGGIGFFEDDGIIALRDNAIHLARELRDITVREQ